MPDLDNRSMSEPRDIGRAIGDGNADWFATLGADGHDSATEPGNPNIVYAETSFSPSDFRRHGLVPQDIAMAIRAGLDRVDGVKVSLIVDLVRDRAPEGAAQTLAAIEQAVADGCLQTRGGAVDRRRDLVQAALQHRQQRRGFRQFAVAGADPAPHVEGADD
mgnify:CR=1 FL=1